MCMDRTRICALPECECAIVRKKGETRQNFERRKFCSRECAAAMNNRRRG